MPTNGLSRKTIVLGIGNDLMTDDGIGIKILEKVEQLLEKNPKKNVKTIAANTDPRYIWTEVKGEENIILTDAINMGNKPGTVYKFSGDDFYDFLDEHGKKGAFHAHDISIFDIIIHSKNSGMKFGQITLVGIEPKEVKLGLNLSREVEKSINTAAEKVITEIENLQSD